MFKYIELYLLACYFTFIFFSSAYSCFDTGILNSALKVILSAVVGIVTYKLWINKLKKLLNKIKNKYNKKNNNLEKIIDVKVKLLGNILLVYFIFI